MSGKRKKNEKGISKINLVFRILALIFVIATAIVYIAVLKINLIPSLYITIFTIVEILITVLIVGGLAKKHKTYKLNIVCLIIALLFSGIYVPIINYANATTNFLHSMFQEVEEQEEYYIVVRKESNYNELEDIKNVDVYQFQVEDNVTKEINNEVNINFKKSDNLTKIGEDLVKSKIDSILVSASQYSILKEEIENFENDTKIIYTKVHKVIKSANIETDNSKYNIENGTFNIYISGIDTYGSINNVSRSDSNTVITVNLNTHEILLTSIPRDYYVTLHSKKAKDKLTHSGIYGITETVTTVEDLLDIDINYYVRVNFTTLIKLIDTLGGVDVYSDYNFSKKGYNFQKGYNHLNGESALVFSRERYSFAGGDNQRIKNQQKVIEAIINKVSNSTTILTKYTSILNSLSGSFNTNIEQDEISRIVKSQLANMQSWEVKSISLTGTGASSSTYSMGSQKLYVMNPNQESVNEAKSTIKSVMGN